MLIDSQIRSKDKTVDAYIEALEKELQSFQGAKVKLLIRSIDNMAGKISKDLDLIASEEKNPNGTEVELSSKLVDTFLKMVKEVQHINNFQQVVSALDKIPEVKEETTESQSEEPTKSVTGLKIGENPMEAIIKKRIGGK
jgi:hypothetical protein